MHRISPQATGALSFGLVTAAAGALGLPKWVWLITLGIGVLLGIWALITYLRGHGEPKLSVRVQALSDEVAGFHQQRALAEPDWRMGDFQRASIEQDVHRKHTQAEWTKYATRIHALVTEAQSEGVEAEGLTHWLDYHMLAGVHPIQVIAGQLAALASTLRRAGK